MYDVPIMFGDEQSGWGEGRALPPVEGLPPGDDAAAFLGLEPVETPENGEIEKKPERDAFTVGLEFYDKLNKM